MLKKEFTPEEMKENEKYFCNNCNNYTPLAIKKSFISKTPNYLILTLNRFWFDFKLQKRNKIMKIVDIPFHLNLEPYFQTSEKTIPYELYAILIHKVIEMLINIYCV